MTIVRLMGLALALAAPAVATPVTRTTAAETIAVHVTYYVPTGSPTFSGEWPYDGSAGCSVDIPLGTVLALPDGRTVRCNDRGADAFMAPHVDVFCPYAASVCDAIPGVGNWTVPVPAVVLAWGG